MRSHGLFGFSVLEFVIAAIVLIVVAALAVPRFSQASDGPALSGDARASVAALRNAIERYCYDHVAWPSQKSDGAHEAGTEAAFIAQLTQYTDRDGVASQVKTPRFCFGPYLVDGVPPCPIGVRTGEVGVYVVRDATLPGHVAEAVAAGWVFNCDTGVIALNCDGADVEGVRYDRY